jgi:hypothetical protein
MIQVINAELKNEVDFAPDYLYEQVKMQEKVA